MTTQPDTETDTFDASLAELYHLADRLLADRLLAAIKLHGGIDYARTQLAAHNIGCGIQVQA